MRCAHIAHTPFIIVCVGLLDDSLEDHFFRFEAPNAGETVLTAIAGESRDEILIRHVDEPNPAYIFQEEGAILSWQEITEPEGFYSLNDTLGDISKSEAGRKLVEEITARIPPRKGPIDADNSDLMKKITAMVVDLKDTTTTFRKRKDKR